MNILSDIRFAFRLLVKNPSSSLMAIVTMAVGTGVAITMFTFVNGILWSSLGLKEEREILQIEWSENDRLTNRKQLRALDYEVLKAESKTFEKMTSYRWDNQSFYNPSGDGFAQKYGMAFVESDFFTFLESAPLLGRTFLPEDVASGKEDKLVISHSVWQEHFGGKAEAIGSIAMMGGQPCTVVGVMPDGFYFPDDVKIWVGSNWSRAREMGRMYGRRIWTLGVLGDGVSQAQAKAELDTIAKRLAQEFPETNEELTSVRLKSHVIWYSGVGLGNSFEVICYALLFCAFLVLTVASANVFNLVMTRVATRTSELSIRNAMGASRSQIVMQVMLDGLILTTLGAIGGILIAGWSLKLIWAKFSIQKYVPYWWHMEVDGAVLGFVVAIVILSALASSLVPGLRAARSSVAENLKDDSRTSSSLFIGALSKSILGFQITITGVLAFVSVMMLLVWVHMKSREFPYNPDSLLSSQLQIKADRDNPSERQQKMSLLKERIMSNPGVEAVAFCDHEGGGAIPNISWSRNVLQIEVEGEIYETEESRLRATRVMVSEGFDEVFGVEPLLGRSTNTFDTFDSQPVCMVNKAFADYYWPNQDPIGKGIKTIGSDTLRGYRTVVGVLPNVLPKPMPGDDLIESGYLKYYIPYSQVEWADISYLVVKANGNPLRLTEPLRKALKDVDPTQAFSGRSLTLRELFEQRMVVADLVFGMFGVFGTASLILGMVGLYAIMSFTTRQRFREFGIRMALGATSQEIMMAVIRRGGLLLLIGGVLGMAAGHASSMVLKSAIDLHELPLGYTYPIVACILVMATVFSMGLPAWRASRLEPSKALRVQ